MRKLLWMTVLTFLLVAGSANAQVYYKMSPMTGQSGYRSKVFETVTASDYLRAPAFGFMRFSFRKGATFAATVNGCETDTYSATTCTLLTTLSASSDNIEVETGLPWIIIDVTAAETSGSVSYVNFRGHVTNAGGGGGSAGGALAVVVPSEDCGDTNANQVVLTAASGIHRIIAPTCIENDTIVIPNLSNFDTNAGIQMAIVNDSGATLLVDASTSGNTVVNEAGSSTVPAGSTFSVLQTAASTVHIIGTGVGASKFVAGVDGVANVPDPRDLDNDGVYNEVADTMTCSAGTCTFESITGNSWIHNSKTSTWKCHTCNRERVPIISRNMDVAASGLTTCFLLHNINPSPGKISSGSMAGCTGVNSNFTMGSSASGVASAGTRFVIDKFCMTASTNLTGAEGIKLEVLGTLGSVTLSTLNAPATSSTTMLGGATLCSTDLPILVPVVDGTSGMTIAIKPSDGDFCGSGSGAGTTCTSAGSNGTLSMVVTEL